MDIALFTTMFTMMAVVPACHRLPQSPMTSSEGRQSGTCAGGGDKQESRRATAWLGSVYGGQPYFTALASAVRPGELAGVRPGNPVAGSFSQRKTECQDHEGDLPIANAIIAQGPY